MKIHALHSLALALLLGAAGISAQAPAAPAPAPAGPPAPDTPAVRRHVDAARKAAGTQWAEAVDYLCAPNQTRANRADDPQFPPTKIFDNVYAIGRTGTVVYALTTSDGIVLIDAGYGDQVESVLLPGMKQLGLDPAQVKYVLITHGHADHFGGAAYFQERGAHVALSAADWMQIENATNANTRPPKRDIVVTDGMPLTIGTTTITPVSIPGHTPGSVGYIFPVKDGRSSHTAALFGGTILLGGRASAQTLDQYAESVAHFSDVTHRMKVDVELQNHPLYDAFERRLDAVRARRAGQPNPFVVGSGTYQRFVTVMSECTQAHRERRRAASQPT